MVPSGHDQFGVGEGSANDLKRLNHELKPFVGSPFAERQDAMLWIAASGKVGILRSAR
jgi:hypothetical protein